MLSLRFFTMKNMLLYLFYWVVVGIIGTTLIGVQSGFFWFIMLGLPASLIIGGLILAFAISVIGVIVSFVTMQR